MRRTDESGVTGEAPFHITSDTELSRRDRYGRVLDEVVFAPLRIIWEDWRARAGFLIVGLFILMGTVGVLLVEPTAPGDGPRLAAPLQTMEYPLGTDTVGRDIFAQIVHATPAMLIMITAGAVFSTAIAGAVGIFSGYKGGWIDTVAMTITDIAMTIPGLPLVMILAIFIEPKNPILVGVVLSINAWAGLARSLRSQVLTLREESYVEAARAMDIPTHRILVKEITPNLMPYITVSFVNSARGIIYASVGLYFLGVLTGGSLNWGVMLNNAYNAGSLFTLTIAHWLIAAIVPIIMLSLGLILLAQGMDRIFNPKIIARHTKTSSNEESDDSHSQGDVVSVTGGTH